MNTAIKLNTETIETVMTYSEWEKIHIQKARKRKAERTYYIKQKLSGLTMAAVGIITPILLDGDATFSLVNNNHIPTGNASNENVASPSNKIGVIIPTATIAKPDNFCLM